MILAIDVYYREQDAKSVGVLFQKWEDETPADIIVDYSSDYGEYEPGAFYKRELPCIMRLLGKADLSELDIIIVDGYVYLDNEYKPGLGYYLYEALDKKIPVIGVAKKSFHTNRDIVETVCRGESKNPLYVTSCGLPTSEAARYIRQMAGSYRLPTLLKLMDTCTKEE